MSAEPVGDEILVSRCDHCHGRFLPRPGPCPSCGSLRVAPHRIPPRAAVLAATELLAPAAGWRAPHRLALVEAAESVRILALVDGELPEVGSYVTVRRDGERYVVRAEPGGARGTS